MDAHSSILYLVIVFWIFNNTLLLDVGKAKLKQFANRKLSC